MSSISSRDQNQEMDAAFAANDVQNAEIFVLDVDCLWEVFDYISLADLCAMGMTCKRFHRAAGRYFTINYPFEQIWFHRQPSGKIEQLISARPPRETNFANYAKRIVFGRDIREYRYAAAQKLTQVKKIKFEEVFSFSDELLACIARMNIMKQVKTIELAGCSGEFIDALLNRILPSCSQLKNLILEGTQTEYSDGASWKQQQCPTLERFELFGDCGDFFETGGIDFLRANSHIKKYAATHFCPLREDFRTLGMRLDELEYYFSVYNDELRDAIIALNAEGYVSQFKLNVIGCNEDGTEPMMGTRDNQLDLSWFTSLKMECNSFGQCPDHNATTIASLVNLKKLYFFYSQISLDEAELLSKALVNLGELHLHPRLIFAAMPFARRLPKLRVITVDYENRNVLNIDFVIDLNALNHARAQLPDAEVLQIYLVDEVYRRVRWTSIDMSLDLVQVRRFSYQGDEYW